MASQTTHYVSHAPEASDPQSASTHTRNLSTVSSATLLTNNTTLHSPPYEPLLRPISPSSAEYYDLHIHSSKESDRNLALPRFSQNNILSREGTNSASQGHKPSLSHPRTRFQLRRWGKRILQTIMSLWSIYSTVRYLLAFTVYQSITGQVVSLVLGSATGLSFAFSSCGSILTMAQTPLLLHGISVKTLLSVRVTLYYMASCCFLGPSIVNLVLLLLWKKNPDIELLTRYRCRLDVDLVWSVTYSLCNHKNRSWGRWVALSALRLALTLIVIIAFHAIASSPQFIPGSRASITSWYTHPKSKKSHNRLESCETPLMHAHSQSSVVMPHLSQDPALQRQKSESTLSSKSSPRNRLRNSRSRSSAASEEETQILSVPNNSTAFLPTNMGPVENTNGLFERFNQAIADIFRETEEAIRFARSDSTSSHVSGSSDERGGSPNHDLEDGHQQSHYVNANDDEDDFYSNPAIRTVEVHNDPNYRADEHVCVMGGYYVRRMPTIASMGSRERPSLSSFNAGELAGTGSSRPPTRNTLASASWGTDISGSEPRSRPNSLSAQAEVLAAGMFNTTEIGELMMRGETVRMVGSQHELSATDDRSKALGEAGDGYASGTTGSKGSNESKESSSGVSYHTASTGSTMSLTSKLADATATSLALPTYPSPLRNV
ncbi:hypothetical protein BDN70DRAFT_77863 [Pholiota conissans]|uniref:Uncharacterized protein n=1 Tax=Pholiota conissans TaxID=109636 RepID=A0A9P5Z083_9AGAR|nr:hypothetical protein BDN70DRAFT_77863 [Pholiota conissans]